MPDDSKPEKQRRATALRYERGEHAPKVSATGRGLVADRIIAAAKEAGVPVRSDPALAEALSTLELDADVPEAMWKAVAETLAWAYQVDARANPSGRGG
jgi:flagellar biosynthesis protein